ncbi:hypothetical protein T492DRAFT_969626 [Pavlovales sp. CCMP2436]|nr:hypothetical protein T492DRAFT_969626 [Pavlovales sp. CCMP2436]
MWKAVLLCACVLAQCTDAHRVVGTAPQRSLVTPRRPGPVLMSDEGEGGRKPLNFFQKLAQGLDDLVDDALDRKLGNGASFYGKRKSNFYGTQDEMKKADPRAKNAEEDYKGNAGGSYFIWDKELDMPLTRKQVRMKKAGKLVLPSREDTEER